MLVAIISDIHDNLIYLEKCLNYCLSIKVEMVLCCGDITSNETIEKLAGFNKEVYLIRGNADNFTDEIFSKLPTIHYLGRTGEIILDNKKIGLCHEPIFIEKMLSDKDTSAYDFIFYGHTHKPWVESRGKTQVVNPGTLGGGSTPSTFAVWDTSKPLPELVRTSLL